MFSKQGELDLARVLKALIDAGDIEPRPGFRGAGLVDHGPEGVRQGYGGQTAKDKVKKILEALPKGSEINRLEIIKKTNIDPSFLTKIINLYPEKAFNVVHQSSGRPGVLIKKTTPKLEKLSQKLYGKSFKEIDKEARTRIRTGKVTSTSETPYVKEKLGKRFDKESQYRYGKDYKDLNRATQQLIREGRTQTVGGVSSSIWKPREKLKDYVEKFKKRTGRLPYLFELTNPVKGGGFNFDMVKRAVDEGVISLGKSGYANPWQESRMKLVNEDLLKLSKNKKILAAFKAADSKELVKLTQDILNLKDANVAEGRVAQLGAVFSGDRYAPNIKKNPQLEKRVSDIIEGLTMNRRERRRLADLKIGKAVGESTTLASPRQYITEAYPEKWIYDIDEPAGVLSSVKNKTVPYGVFAQIIDRDINRKTKKSYDSIKSKQERIVQEAIQTGDKAQINKAIKNFNDTASKYEKIFAKNTKSGEQKIRLLKISLDNPKNTIERFDKLPEDYQTAFKKNYQARGYSFKVPTDLKTAFEIAKDIKNPQIAAIMGKRAKAGEARLYSSIPGVSQLFDMAKSIPGDFAKKKYLRAGFKTLGIAATPLIIYDAYQAAKEGKPFAEIIERGLIGTEGVYKAKEYMSLSPEAKEASARINMQKMAEAGREDPRVKGYGGEWQPDFVKPEDEQQLLAEKEKYRLKREGEDQARARAYLDAVLGIKDLATGARFTQPSYGMELARGGLTRTVAPDSGPMSQGLRSLYIDDMD